MRKFIVSSFIGDNQTNEADWETHELDEDQMKTLAQYYYNNSEVTDDIDLSNIDNAIEFVERVDVVREVEIPSDHMYGKPAPQVGRLRL